MSHFVILAVTDHRPTEETVDEIMAPFYETSEPDAPYVEFVDNHDEVAKEYSVPKALWKLPDEHQILRDIPSWNLPDETFRDPTPEEQAILDGLDEPYLEAPFRFMRKDWSDGKGIRDKIAMSDNEIEKILKWEKVDRDHTKNYSTLDEFAKEYYGYTEQQDGRWGYLANPNAKWDWYQIGGRWKGMLKAKDPSLGQAGEDSFFSGETDPNGLDILTKENIDVEAIKSALVAPYRETMKELIAETGKNREEILAEWKSYAEFRLSLSEISEKAKIPIWTIVNGMEEDHPYKISSKSPVIRALSPHLPDTETDPDGYMEKIRPISAFAILKDGEWHERGSMGWWAVVTDEDASWEDRFTEIFNSIRDDQWITVVDCHI